MKAAALKVFAAPIALTIALGAGTLAFKTASLFDNEKESKEPTAEETMDLHPIEDVDEKPVLQRYQEPRTRVLPHMAPRG